MKNDEMKEKTITILKATGEKFQNIFTKKRLKQALILLVVAGIMGAGGSYFLHQNKVQAKLLEREARTQIILNMSKQDNINLISQDEAKDIAAQHINTTVDSLTFKNVYLEKYDLKDNDHDYKNKEHKKDRKKHNKKEHRRNEVDSTTHATEPVKQPTTTPSAQPAQSLGNAQQMLGRTPALQKNISTSYIYKVSCAQNKMNYKFTINAQTGKVLEVKTKASYF